MDYQATLDKVYNGIFAQGGPSVNEAGFCKYRGINGRKCAGGQLINDDQYDESFEGKIVGGGSNYKLNSTLIENGYTDLIFIRDLQKCHDYPIVEYNIRNKKMSDSEFLQKFHEKIVALATEYKLTPQFAPNFKLSRNTPKCIFPAYPPQTKIGVFVWLVLVLLLERPLTIKIFMKP